MNKESLSAILQNGTIKWRRHALERMLERGISRNEVKEALVYGEMIEKYKTDLPFESALFFHHKSRTLHVVASLDKENMILYVITAYLPDTKHFYDDLKTRKKDENK